jgi:hypothetical protein
MQASQTAPQLYNPAELHKRFLQLINLPDYDRVLSVPQASGRLNAVAENESALAGTPMQAFPEQDHLAHIKTHVEFLASPIYGMNPMFIQKMQGLVQHTMEHVGLLYAQAFNDALMNENEEIAILEAEGVPQTDQKLAELNPGILAGVEELLQPYVDQMAQILQKISEAMPNQETDPRMAKVHVDEMELQRKSQKDQMDYEIAKEKIQEDKQYNANMLQVEQIKTSTELKIEQMRGARAHGNEVRTAQAQAHEMRLKDAKHMLEVQKVQDQSRQQSVASKQKPTK